jgi:DNA-binding transcriptional LysR family regulator
LARAFARVGTAPEVVQEARSKFTVLSLVAAGLGVALMPASARVWRRVGVVFCEIEGELPAVELAAIWPKDREHPARARLVALARAGAGGGGG